MSGAGIYIKTPSGLVAAATVPGKQGSQGPQSSLTPGTITTGAAGTNAAATITGPGPVQTLNLTIPKGDPGGWVNSALVAAGTNLDTITAAGLYFLTGDASLNTIALNYPTNGYSGYLEVIYAAGSTILQRLTPASPLIGASTAINRGTWIRTRYGTWGPWQRMAAVGEPGGSDLTGTGSPEGVLTAPVGIYYTDTAITNGAMRWAKKTGSGNTGWVCIVGDTGLRNIGTLVTGTYHSGGAACRLARVGPVVFLTMDVVTVAGFTATSVLTLPAGFRTIPTYISPGYAGSAWYGINPGITLNTAGANPGIRGHWSWHTAEPWPTTLPGTAA